MNFTFKFRPLIKSCFLHAVYSMYLVVKYWLSSFWFHIVLMLFVPCTVAVLSIFSEKSMFIDRHLLKTTSDRPLHDDSANET